MPLIVREQWYFGFERESVFIILVAMAVGLEIRWNSSAYFWQPGEGGSGGSGGGGSLDVAVSFPPSSFGIVSVALYLDGSGSGGWWHPSCLGCSLWCGMSWRLFGTLRSDSFFFYLSFPLKFGFCWA